MSVLPSDELPLAGRKRELEILQAMLSKAASGNGAVALITGEAGVGKSRLMTEFGASVSAGGAKLLYGCARPDSNGPFRLFTDILGDELPAQYFHEEKYTAFSEVFAVNRAGLLVAQASSAETEMDPDIFAGMLSAVQDFVRDSFDRGTQTGSGLGKLEYGDMKIFIEHGNSLFLAAVLKGEDHRDMSRTLRNALRDIEAEHGDMLSGWTGKIRELGPLREKVAALSRVKFLVRRDFQGVSLRAERLRISNLILDFITGLAESKPLVMILEDIHLADESSMFVLDFLGRNISGSRIMLVLTQRPDGDSARGESVKRLASESNASVINLDALNRRSLEAITDSMFSPNSFPADFRERLMESSGGNPFFLVETLKHMAVTGGIAFDGEAGCHKLLQGDMAIPASVEELVNKRLENLDPDALAMSEYVSCIGRTFSRSAAMSMASLRDPENSLAALHSQGIIRILNGTCEFSHALIQEVIYSGLSPRWRMAHHGSIGKHLESEYADMADDVMYDLARHFSGSGDREKAFDYLLKAGDKAANAYAPEQALAYYTDASSLVPKLRSISPEKRALLHAGMGGVYAILGKYSEALDWYRKAMETENVSSRKARLYLSMADVHTWMTEYDSAQKDCEAGIELLDNDGSLMAGFLNAQGRICIRRGDLDSAGKHFEKGLAIARRLGDDKTIGMVEMLMGVIYTQKGMHQKALEHYNRGLAIEEESGNIYGIATCLNNMGLTYQGLGEMDRALECHTNSLALKRKIGDKYTIAGSLINIGLVYYEMGDLDLAAEYYGQAFEIKEKLGDRYGLSLIYCHLGMVFHHKGDLEKALENFSRTLDMTETTKDKYQIAVLYENMGSTYLTFNRLDQALEYYVRSAELADEINAHQTSAQSNLGLAETMLLKGSRAGAEEYLKKAEGPIMKQLGHEDISAAYHVHALLCIARKEWSEGETILRNALARFGKNGMRKELAQIFYDYATLLNASGRPAEASEKFEKALALFTDMGMMHWKEKAEAALKELSQ